MNDNKKKNECPHITSHEIDPKFAKRLAKACKTKDRRYIDQEVREINLEMTEMMMEACNYSEKDVKKMKAIIFIGNCMRNALILAHVDLEDMGIKATPLEDIEAAKKTFLEVMTSVFSASKTKYGLEIDKEFCIASLENFGVEYFAACKASGLMD